MLLSGWEDALRAELSAESGREVQEARAIAANSAANHAACILVNGFFMGKSLLFRRYRMITCYRMVTKPAMSSRIRMASVRAASANCSSVQPSFL